MTPLYWILLGGLTLVSLLFGGPGPSGPAAELPGALMVLGFCGVASSLIWALCLVWLAHRRGKGGGA